MNLYGSYFAGINTRDGLLVLSANFEAGQYRKTNILCILTHELEPNDSWFRKYVAGHQLSCQIERTLSYKPPWTSIKVKIYWLSKYTYDLRGDTPGIMSTILEDWSFITSWGVGVGGGRRWFSKKSSVWKFYPPPPKSFKQKFYPPLQWLQWHCNLRIPWKFERGT